MLLSFAKDEVIESAFGVDDHLVDLFFKDHPGDRLKSIFEGALSLFHGGDVVVQTILF